MKYPRGWVWAVGLALAVIHVPAARTTGLPGHDLAGTWAGLATHDGETRPIALEIEAGEDSAVTLRLSFPVAHLHRLELARRVPRVEGDSVHLGSFHFAHDRRAGTLTGNLPPVLVPVYSIPIVLRRVERFDPPPRVALDAPLAAPRWTFEAGSPLWAGPTLAGAVVYVGAQDGGVHALEAASGKELWARRLGGPIRTRLTASGEALYVQADDGFLYKLDAASGERLWQVRIVERPIERLPFDDPRSRYDRFGSDVTVSGARLLVGTHDGKVLALDAARGERLWEFQAGDAVLAAPALAGNRVLFGSYDRHVYALDAATGRLLWKRDTQGAVVSAPAIEGHVAVVGNRCYDLLGLDVRTGEVLWKRYVWMSWVESSATIRGGVAYVGSSDAAAVLAFETRTGRPMWSTDVHGWSWGQPAVTARSVVAGTSGQAGYPVPHHGGVVALDRRSGRILWRYATPAPDSGAYGIPGSPAVGSGRIFVGGLDGRVLAFDERR